MRTRVKICCISSVEEAQMAVSAGADALGLVSAMPSGPGVVAEEVIAAIVNVVPPAVATFLLTSQVKASEIIDQQKFCKNNVLQLVDHVDPSEHEKLRHALPGIGIVQVVHVIDEASVEQALEYAPYVDALLMDSGNPNLEVKELGGTGRTHNWDLSREIVQKAGVPVFLAGGLNPENVAKAIREVSPFGLDICSGVRSDGLLNAGKLGRFMKVVHGA